MTLRASGAERKTERIERDGSAHRWTTVHAGKVATADWRPSGFALGNGAWGHGKTMLFCKHRGEVHTEYGCSKMHVRTRSTQLQANPATPSISSFLWHPTHQCDPLGQWNCMIIVCYTAPIFTTIVVLPWLRTRKFICYTAPIFTTIVVLPWLRTRKFICYTAPIFTITVVLPRQGSRLEVVLS